MTADKTVSGGRQATAAPSALRILAVGAALIVAGPGLQQVVDAQQISDEVVIVRGYDKLGDAKFEFAPTRKGAIICYAYDHNGKALGHQRGYTQARSIRFYGIPFEDVGEVTCERQD